MNSLVIVVACALLAVAASDETARLLVSKNVLNNYLAEGKDLAVTYGVYNIGGTAAVDVQLGDGSFDDEMFEVVAGSLTASWPRIAPGTNVTHAVVLRPLVSVLYNFTVAQVTYKTSEEAAERQVGYSTAPGQGGIYAARDYDRKFSSHALDWAAFSLMTLPSLVFPFLLWYSSASKYDATKAKKQ